jgi:hypothetical protein
MPAKQKTVDKPNPINLLPHELMPKKYALKLSKSLKRFIILGFAIFTIATIVVIGAIVVLAQRNKQAIKEMEQLTTEIENLNATEQRLILVRDRLEKIDKIANAKSAASEIDTFDETLDRFTDNVTFRGVEIGNDSADVTVRVPSSRYMGRFVSVLATSGGYENIKLLSFKYSEVTFGLSK